MRVPLASDPSKIAGALKKFGTRVPRPAGRPQSIKAGKGPSGKGSLSSVAVKARNSRLESLAKDLEALEPDAWPTATSTGGGRGEALFPRGSQQQPASHATRAQMLNEGLLLGEDGKPVVSPILARDACQCSECVDPSDRQRNFSYANIPTDISFSKVSRLGKDKGSIVSWNNDAPPHHPGESIIFDNEVLASLIKKFRNSHWRLYDLPQRLWDAESFTRESNRIDFNEYINDDNTLAEALHLLWRDGLVFVDGVPESEGSVSQIASRIGPLMTTFYGPTWDVRSVPDAKNVAYTAKYLGFHMDLLYMREPPAFQLLHCIHNESVGGESRFADTFKAVDSLYNQDPSKVVDLMSHEIRYEYDNDGYFYSDSKPTISKRPNKVPKRPTHNAEFPLVISDVDGVHWSPPFVGDLCPRGHNQLVRLVSASKAFSDILERPDMVVEEKMDCGTCVIFDNLRVVHARNAFDMNSGRRWLRGAYLARQDFISKASSLMDKFPANFTFGKSDSKASKASS